MQKKNNKGVIALIIVLVLAAAALVIWQTNKPETQQGGKEITINVDHLNGDDTTFTIHTDEEYLRGALEQEDLIEGTESEYGLYVRLWTARPPTRVSSSGGATARTARLPSSAWTASPSRTAMCTTLC